MNFAEMEAMELRLIDECNSRYLDLQAEKMRYEEQLKRKTLAFSEARQRLREHQRKMQDYDWSQEPVEEE